jgi:hypothetical protein
MQQKERSFSASLGLAVQNSPFSFPFSFWVSIVFEKCEDVEIVQERSEGGQTW